ncbi:MAG: enoyl-CoA hydratase/isomerase family protein [Pseudorhodoplanes sp.]
MTSRSSVGVSRIGAVAVVELQRPPHNFLDLSVVQQLAVAYEEADANDGVRAVVLCAQGKSFCAGADFQDPHRSSASGSTSGASLYREALRLYGIRKPVVAAVQGAAVGGGLGLAVSADFRITCLEARFSANFTRIGTHPGFGLTWALPNLIGINKAELMFYTGRRIGGEQAVAWGLANECVPQDQVKERAIALATEIAECAPLALLAARATLRSKITDSFVKAVDHEFSVQSQLHLTTDFREGVRAYSERRPAHFVGR